MTRPKLLLLVASPATFAGLGSFLRANGFEVEIQLTAERGNVRGSVAHDLIVIEHLPTAGCNGLNLASEIRCTNPSVPLILATSEGSEELAIEALRMGLQDYLKIPTTPSAFLSILKRNLRQDYYSKSGLRVPEKKQIDNRMVASSRAMLEIQNFSARAARTNCTVLITGETGTGKELIAQFIHENSSRRHKPFVCLNCAAIPDTLLENELFGHDKGAFTGAQELRAGLLSAADGGTVFLDEIGDLSSFAQAKILRVLETREFCRLGGIRQLHVDLRFIAATNQDLNAMTAQKTFRQDLFYRLDVAHVHLPPLRERREDIPLLVRQFSEQSSRQDHHDAPEFTDEFLRALLVYDWPGNVRELKNFVERLFLAELPAKVGAEFLPAHLRQFLETSRSLSDQERELVIATLFSTQWNKTKAAERLNWSRMTLYRKIAKYHISIPPLAESPDVAGVTASNHERAIEAFCCFHPYKFLQLSSVPKHLSQISSVTFPSYSFAVSLHA